MGKPLLSVRLKDPQPYYLEDESIECVVDLKSEKVLKDPVITIIFKGRSSCYNNFSRIYHVPIFDIEQEIKHPRIDMESSSKKIVSADFKVEVPKTVSIPSSRPLEVGDGGKIEYMVEAVLDTASLFKRSVQATSIIVIPMLSKINVDKEELSRLIEKETRWPRNEADVNTCTLNASIPRGGWVRGSNVPVYVSWRQPERMNAVKSVVFTLVRQELISSSKDTPPDMTKQLKDKVVERTEKEISLTNGPNRIVGTNLQHSIEIPSNIVPTIDENGKVMRLDYKICVTVKVPEMEPNGGDKELSINLPIVIGTEGKMIMTNEVPSEFRRGSLGGESLPNSPGGFRMPEPMIIPPSSYPPPPQMPFVINPERNIYTSMNEEDMPTGMPVPFFDRPDSINEDSRNNSSTGYFSPASIPDVYPPLDNQSYTPESNNISLDTSNFSPMPSHIQANNRESNYNDFYTDEEHSSNTQRKSPPTIYYKPEEGSPK